MVSARKIHYAIYICFRFVLLVLTFETVRFTVIVCSPLRSNCWINPLTPNDPYRGRTTPLTSKVAFYVFIKKI